MDGAIISKMYGHLAAFLHTTGTTHDTVWMDWMDTNPLFRAPLVEGAPEAWARLGRAVFVFNRDLLGDLTTAMQFGTDLIAKMAAAVRDQRYPEGTDPLDHFFMLTSLSKFMTGLDEIDSEKTAVYAANVHAHAFRLICSCPLFFNAPLPLDPDVVYGAMTGCSEALAELITLYGKRRASTDDFVIERAANAGVAALHAAGGNISQWIAGQLPGLRGPGRPGFLVPQNVQEVKLYIRYLGKLSHAAAQSYAGLVQVETASEVLQHAAVTISACTTPFYKHVDFQVARRGPMTTAEKAQLWAVEFDATLAAVRRALAHLTYMDALKKHELKSPTIFKGFLKDTVAIAEAAFCAVLAPGPPPGDPSK